MRIPPRLALAAAAVTLLVAPAAIATPPAGTGGPGASSAAETAPGSGAPRGKAYGWYCRAESRKHVKGEKGTPFSRCVTAMAHLATGKADTPREACAGLSRKHVKGEKGTPFSRCVAAGATLLADLDEQAGAAA